MGALRLLLAFAVVAAHSPGASLYLGRMAAAAVPGFFVISGFYMHLVLDTKYRGALGAFYTNRFLRLFPAYWVVLAVAILLGALPSSGLVAVDRLWVMPANVSRLLFDGSTISKVAWVPNLGILGADVFRVLAIDTGGGLVAFPTTGETPTIRGLYRYLYVPQIWSVANEIVFYAAAPWLVRLSTPWLGVVAAASLGATSMPRVLYWGHLLPSHNASFFVLGMLAYRALPLVTRLPAPLARALAMVPFVVCVGWPWLGRAWWIVVPAWIVYSATVPVLFRVGARWRAQTALGELSYPVYLCHMLFVNPAIVFGPYACVAAFAASCAFSAILVRFVDRPIETLRQRVAFRRVAPALS